MPREPTFSLGIGTFSPAPWPPGRAVSLKVERSAALVANDAINPALRVYVRRPPLKKPVGGVW